MVETKSERAPGWLRIHSPSATKPSVMPLPFAERLIRYDIHQSTHATAKKTGWEHTPFPLRAS